MKKLLMIIPLALILCFMVGCPKAPQETPNVKAIRGDRSNLILKIDYNGNPDRIVTNDDLLLCKFLYSSKYPNGATMYFYLRNEGAAGSITLRVSALLKPRLGTQAPEKDRELTRHVESGKKYSLAVPVLFGGSLVNTWSESTTHGEFHVKVWKGNIMLDEISFTVPATKFGMGPFTFRELE